MVTLNSNKGDELDDIKFYVLTIEMNAPCRQLSDEEMEAKYGEEWEEMDSEYEEYDEVKVFVGAIYTDDKQQLDEFVQEKAAFWNVPVSIVSVNKFH